MVAEAFLPAYGSLGIGGVIAFVLGSIMLIEDTSLPGFEIPLALIAASPRRAPASSSSSWACW